MQFWHSSCQCQACFIIMRSSSRRKSLNLSYPSSYFNTSSLCEVLNLKRLFFFLLIFIHPCQFSFSSRQVCDKRRISAVSSCHPLPSIFFNLLRPLQPEVNDGKRALQSNSLKRKKKCMVLRRVKYETPSSPGGVCETQWKSGFFTRKQVCHRWIDG